MFLTPWKQTPWGEQVIESILYTLWDLGLKIGHSSRSLNEMVRMAKGDLTIRTALLESRYIWGDQALYDEGMTRFAHEVVAGNARAFVADKLVERDERHKRMGDSRSEEHTSELQSLMRISYAVFCLKKKTKND